jgi:hypothetical protein
MTDKRKFWVLDYLLECTIEKEVLGLDADINCFRCENEKDLPDEITELIAVEVWHKITLSKYSIERLSSCKAIVRAGVGYDNIDYISDIAGEQELENLQLAYIILDLCNKPKDQIRFIDEYNIRPGHDRRYALNTDKLKALGWAPKMSLLEGIKYTVEWYKNIIKKWEYGNI